MTKRVFTNCLNTEPKIYNSPVGGIIGCGILLFIFGIWQGLLYGLGGSAIGYIVGCWLSKQWFTGQVQRQIYWYLPGAKTFIDKNIPESCDRNLI